MTFKKGDPRPVGAGRKKGIPNKSGAVVKNALLDVFTKMGGVAGMTRWAKENPTEFYKLLVKLLPQEVIIPGGPPTRITIVEVVRNSPSPIAIQNHVGNGQPIDPEPGTVQ